MTARRRARRSAVAVACVVLGVLVAPSPASATTTQTGTCTQNMVQVAANAGVSLSTNLDFTIPTDDYVVLQSFRFNVSTNSTAGARQVTLAVLDASGNELWLDPAPTTQAATLTRTYVAQSGHESFALSGAVIGLRLPEFPLVAGWKFRVKATGIGADVISFGWLGYCNSLDNSTFPVAVHTPSSPIRVQAETVTPIDVNVSNTVPVDCSTCSGGGTAGDVNLSGFAGDGLTVPVALGMILFCLYAYFIASMRKRSVL